MQKILEIVVYSAKIGFYIFLLLGGLVVLRYCIGIGYFPAGIDVGDGLFLLSTAIIFAIIVIVSFLSIIYVSTFIVRLLSYPINWLLSLAGFLLKRKMPQINRIDVAFTLSGGIVTIFYALLFFSLGLNIVVISMLVFILIFTIAIGLSLLVFENREPLIHTIAWDFQSREGQQRVFSIVIVMFCALSILYVPSKEVFQLSKFALMQIGVVKRHADIYLDRQMEPVFKGAGKVKNGYLIIKDADILWTGVGSRSVIEVEINGKPRKFVLNSNEISFSYP